MHNISVNRFKIIEKPGSLFGFNNNLAWQFFYEISRFFKAASQNKIDTKRFGVRILSYIGWEWELERPVFCAINPCERRDDFIDFMLFEWKWMQRLHLEFEHETTILTFALMTVTLCIVSFPGNVTSEPERSCRYTISFAALSKFWI